MAYEVLEGGLVPVKAWTVGVPFEQVAKHQVLATARMPFVHSHVAIMPDVHLGIGATVGSVVPTCGAIIPAAVGVDIGCGMMAVRTTLSARDLPDGAEPLFEAIARAVPHGSGGSGGSGGKGEGRKGDWGTAPKEIASAWKELEPGYRAIVDKHRAARADQAPLQLGTLGGGNHFIEVCLDEEQRVWLMLHSGSRGVGNRVGSHFIALARKDMERLDRRLPNKDLAYLEEGTEHFADYMQAVDWAQAYARTNRDLMMERVVTALRRVKGLPPFHLTDEAINCHHNYVAREHHYGKDVYVTRKGAVRAQPGDLGIIPGSMGTRSFIVRGKGNAESFHSCSHGAGRVMPRGVAKRTITLEQHAAATAGVACRKDADVIDESPAAYKDVDLVMKAQEDLVEIVHTLKQIACVKG